MRARLTRSRRPLAAPFALAVVLLLGAPQASSAQWSAMLPLVIENIHQAIDTWERHSRILEDHLDKAAGVQNAFNDLNLAYTNVRSGFGMPLHARPPRFGDLYRAGLVDNRCFRYDSATRYAECELRSFLDQDDLNRFRYNLRRLPRTIDGLRDYGDYEWAIREGLPDVLDRMDLPPGPVGDVVRQIPDIVDVYDRAERAFNASRWRARRMASVVESGRRAGRQVLQDDRRSRANPVSDFLDCLNLGGASQPRTLLAVANDADCTRSESTNIDPRGGGDHTQNVSPNEAANLELQALIVQTTMLASQVESAALVREAGVGFSQEIEDARRENFARRISRIEHAAGDHGDACFTFAYAEKCANGILEVDSPAEDAAAAEFLLTMHGP